MGIKNWLNGGDFYERALTSEMENRAGSVGSAGGDSPLAGVVPPPVYSRGTVLVDDALSISAIYRSIQIISNTIAQMELQVFKRGELVATPAIIQRPNIDDTQKGFLEETTFSLAAHGNAYWRVYRNAKGDVNNIMVLDPEVVFPFIDDNTGRIWYAYGDKNYNTDEIKHLKLMRQPGELKGLGPIQASPEEIESALVLKDFVNNWFDQGVPTGYLTTDQQLNGEKSKAIIEAWNKFVKENGTAVLPNGMDYKYLSINPQEAQLVDVQKFFITNIARMFGIPPLHLIAELGGTSLTYLTLETTNLTFLQSTLSKYMNEIESGLSDLLPRGMTVNFNEEDLLRQDQKTKWDIREKQITLGYKTANEFRIEDGLEPLPVVLPPVSPVVDEEEGELND